MGKVSYMRRFIPGVAEFLKPLVEQTKKRVAFMWCDQCEKAFKKIHAILADSHTMVALLPGKTLFAVQSKYRPVIRGFINLGTRRYGEASILHQ